MNDFAMIMLYMHIWFRIGSIQISYHSVLDLREPPSPHSHAIFSIFYHYKLNRKGNSHAGAKPPLRVTDMIFDQPHS